ncbi:hypothetical protein CH63R_05340 [Colletotrichum higginsianum IMI 349063]|uniref:Diels-Alderase ccsF n=1 Tax=Colletotrichum higginsianum (strain IMI 349063) TaxID=759273 RepID=A0A1B7YMA3_COLHI|nr:hypothetical protein CH63R_05340 [Colletotrichum higginsianum IMI 349063]OBR13044.1 hypothetical protein CH63R_05340 [Colletotrichum higginsianum IMI 349063]
MAFRLLLLSSVLIGPSVWAGQLWPEPWPLEWRNLDMNLLDTMEQHVLETDNPGCVISNLTSNEMVKGRKVVDFSTDASENFMLPKIEPLNSTAGDQWAFDGVSKDAKQAFVFGFYRDPNYAILGTGNFRLSIEMALDDGTRFAELYYPERSVIESCAEGIRGMWYDDKDGYRFTWMVKADMSEAIVTLNSDTLQGKIAYHSKSQPRSADGHVWPNANASTQTVRHHHWAQPIVGGNLEFDVEIKGEKVAWTGMGGLERIWTAFSWFTCLTNLQGLRTMLGPYVVSYFRYESLMDKGEIVESAVAFKDGIPIFRSTLGSPSDTEDYIVAQKTYGGAVTGNLKDKVTGFQIDLISPKDKRHYTFSIEHAKLAWEFALGEGVGGSGFTGISMGGHVGQDQYQGVSISEALTFPKNSPLFKSNYVE